mmetsp:Transcript_5265/g.10851  ORF Transcript_5265/g.10851 Transcript_5265/m.10851 type:complete len:358 (+) Transcript_5265:140-1213(+)
MFASTSTRRSVPLSNRHGNMTTIPFAKNRVRKFGTEAINSRTRINVRQGIAAVIIIVLVGRSLATLPNVANDYDAQYVLGVGEERNALVFQEAQSFNNDGLAGKAQHLVMVAGHSVTISDHLKDADSDENDWSLESYQKGEGLPQAIHRHIVAGIEEARKDPKALLVFSGGETRGHIGPQTEAQTYYHVADAMNLWPSDDSSSVRSRATTEEFATDSFENLMFSIARFHEVTGEYPKKITVVSYSFKGRRFETLHAPALRWPSDRFVYVGVDPPASTGFDLERATAGELNNSAAPFEQDPYGCNSEVLQEKRKRRNPFKRTPPYGLSCPEMNYLLSFCGPNLVPIDQVPWVKIFEEN